jgi:hypothetical protein
MPGNEAGFRPSLEDRDALSVEQGGLKRSIKDHKVFLMTHGQNADRDAAEKGAF